MRKSELIEKKAELIQNQIVHCSNHEPWVEGCIMWMHSNCTCIQDLMYDCKVPKELQDAVCKQLKCPKCGEPFSLLTEVGTKYDFQLDHEDTIEHALDRHGKEIFQFRDILREYPMMGMAHLFGKRLLRELFRTPHFTLPEGRWFRAQKLKNYCCGLAPWQKVGDQRFNSSGHPFYYLADNAKCATVELLVGSEEKSAWVQEFHLDRFEDVLDLRPWGAEDERAFDEEGHYKPKLPLLLIALLYSDLLNLKPETFNPEIKYADLRHKPEYLVTRFLSDAARMAGFKAILYRSVRYDGDNLVVFEKDWKPTPHGEPVPQTLTAEELDYSNRRFFYQGDQMEIPNVGLLSDLPPAMIPEVKTGTEYSI